MMLTEVCEKSKVVSSDFSIRKNIAATLSSSSLPIKLICCFKSGLSNSICLFKSIVTKLVYVFKSNHSPINYQLFNYYLYSFQCLLHIFILCLLLERQKSIINQYIEVFYFNTYFEKDVISSSFSDVSANNLLTLLNVGSNK